MNDPTEQKRLETGNAGTPPPTGRRRTIWPNLVWGIPIAAFLTVGYLGVKALLNRGEVVTVTFSKAAGAKAGDTKVLYQGVGAGELTKIEPNRDGGRLDFTLRLVPAAKKGLTTNARFWLIGADPTPTDLSSLKAVVSGVAIGYAPGTGGKHTNKFEGLEHAPLILPSDKGTRYVLNAHTLNAVHEGTQVLFHGQTIGKVIEVKFERESFRLQVFIFQPYDALIRPGVRFWKISPLRLSFTGGAISASLAPASTLLSGGIDMEADSANGVEPQNTPQSKPDAEFPLYSSHEAAREGLSGHTVRYEFAFDGRAGLLDETSKVTLHGFQIGEVERTRLAYNERSGDSFSIVTAVLYPAQMHLTPERSEEPGGDDVSRAAIDAAINRLIRVGYRARLEQTPPLVGEESIDIVRVRGAPTARLIVDGDTPRFPSDSDATGIDEVTAKAAQFLNKLNNIPLEDIGANLKQITGKLGKLMASPELADSMVHLHTTMISIDKLLSEVEPQVGPLVVKLNEAVGELSGVAREAHQMLESDAPDADSSLPDAIRQITEAARSIKTLTDYIDRHPEALLRGKKAEQ